MRAPRSLYHATVLAVVVAALVAAAVPVAARPYGARGRAGEVRYDVKPQPPRCVSFDSGRTRPLCFHRTTTGAHATSNAWFDATVAAFRRAWTTQVGGLGYKRPLADAGGSGYGGTRAVDVYLADVGQDGTLGYCESDRTTAPTPGTLPAFCVVDNDFAGIPAKGAELKGTAAHEFFHAVQYAYDTTTPPWFSEGTAVWMEDQVFDSLDTNYRYLDVTALRAPEDPFDMAEDSANYGSWLFWQFLGECQTPATVRAVWAHVAKQSTDNVPTAVGVATGRPFANVLASFGAWNYGVGEDWAYAEGDAYLGRLGGRPPIDGAHELGNTRTSTDATGSEAGTHRTIAAGPYGVHYVRIKAMNAINVAVEVNKPGGAAVIRQRADGVNPAFARPQLCRDAADGSAEEALFDTTATGEIQLAAGESALLVLTNPSANPATLTYRAAVTP